MSQPPSAEEAALVLFAAAMDAIDVPYAVTGSTAMNFYAVPRMTRDIDVLIGPRRNELSLVARVLAEDFDADHEVILEALRATRMFQIFGKGVPVKLDVIPATAALAGPEMLRRARTFHIDEQPIRVVSPEDLIVAKLYSARESESEMQMRDIANLLQSAKPDLEDVERQSARRGLTPLLRRNPEDNRVNDTSPEVERQYRETLMRLSPLERARAGFAMFDFARKCALAGLRADEPGLSGTDLEVGLLRRIYPDAHAAILDLVEQRLRQRSTADA